MSSGTVKAHRVLISSLSSCCTAQNRLFICVCVCVCVWVRVRALLYDYRNGEVNDSRPREDFVRCQRCDGLKVGASSCDHICMFCLSFLVWLVLFSFSFSICFSLGCSGDNLYNHASVCCCFVDFGVYAVNTSKIVVRYDQRAVDENRYFMIRVQISSGGFRSQVMGSDIMRRDQITCEGFT